MLRNLLKSITRRPREELRAAAPESVRLHPELARGQRLDRAHSGISIDLHRQVLFDGISVAGLPFAPLLDACLRDTLTGVRPAKAFSRYQAGLHLAQYFVRTVDLPGERAECGVFTGAVSLLMCRLMHARKPEFDGTGFHLVDSFEGISEPDARDALELHPAEGDRTEGEFAYAKGAMAAPIEYAQRAMKDFPGAHIHRGWIPSVLSTLPDSEYAFVHIDVDLYEPTLACLAHFHPRLARGGVIVCDDYGARTFPGAARAWNDFCDRRGLGFVALETGQAVILRE
jgi:hypothetical protein